MADFSVSLTQFIDFTLKRSGSARTNFVREIKYREYHPATDYWKQLRDEIKKLHSEGASLEKLDYLVDRVHERKRRNYNEAIKLYKRFFRDKNCEWFNPGSSYWAFNDELIVKSNPEIGLYINGQPHLVKLYFKGQKERIDRHNITSTLTLMNNANFNDVLPDDVQTSVLNIRREKMHTNNFIDDDLLLSLEGDAQQLIYLLKNV
ncbi:hypothetical protein [Lentibacillus cibarius]|uniref:Uncharacterized protein n=1 Tax=Lentibacillus cibarius TaxID=2583219 RepID=A0A5S3QIY2_9BACI|nr:hypothetical protein [Lentibacillus cibarius]TMN21890.1 hypothetical protein FFL34_07005 [Lentibacillus cibarius]